MIYFSKEMPLAEASVFAYCLWHAQPLLHAWQKSPHDRLGWVAFIVWCLPILLRRSLHKPGQYIEKSLFPLLALALGLSFFGSIGSLNALKYTGLAFALAGLAPASPRHTLWFFTAVSWMPFFGWMGSHWFPEIIYQTRLMTAVAGSGFYLLFLQASLDAPPCQT